MNKFSIVFDTNVLVSALLSPSGNPAKIYRMFLMGAVEVLFHEDILMEYEDVLFRPHLRIAQEDARSVIQAIRRVGKKADTVTSVVEMPDEDDRIFYDVATQSGAFLITGNIKHFPQKPSILTPTEFLNLVNDIWLQ